MNNVKNTKKAMLGKHGFLLMEALVSLTTCFLAIILTTGVFKSLNNIADNQTLNFNVFLCTLESKYFNFEIEKLNAHSITLYSKANRKLYHLEKYKDMLRVTGDTRGHIRTVGEVKNVNWTYRNDQLKTIITFENGKQYTASSNFLEHKS